MSIRRRVRKTKEQNKNTLFKNQGFKHVIAPIDFVNSVFLFCFVFRWGRRGEGIKKRLGQRDWGVLSLG